MEEPNKAKIKNLLPVLIEVTICSEILISYLKSKRVISSADEASIKSTQNELERNARLYDVLLTRVGGYKRLVEGLAVTLQTGVLMILDEPCNPSTCTQEILEPPQAASVDQVMGQTDEDNRKKIKELLPVLIELTKCDERFMSYLKSQGVVSSTDEAVITATQNETERNGKLYDILQTRVGGYKRLVEGLALTHQTGVLMILDEPHDPSTCIQEILGIPQAESVVRFMKKPEEPNQEKIQNLLPALIEVTKCGQLLLSYLKSKRVISSADEASIKSTQNEHEKNAKLYDILLTRVDGYKRLVEGLAITLQTKVLLILDEPHEPSTCVQEILEPLEAEKYLEIALLSANPETRKLLAPIQEPIFFNVLPPSELFTGRKNELDELHASLCQAGSTTIISSKSYITGLGGIGKTELARKIVDCLRINFCYIVWINSETEASLKRDFQRLALDKLNINTINANQQEKDVKSIIEDVYSKLQLQKTLLIFDNVTAADFVHKYFPKIANVNRSMFHIVVTSQETQWENGTVIYLSGLTDEDAIEFVKRGLKESIENQEFVENALRLVKRLNNFPLAIDQAIAYIMQRRRVRPNYGPADYICSLKNNTAEILKKHSNIFTDYSKSTYETLSLTIKFFEEFGNEGALAIKLVELMGYLLPDDIQDSIFANVTDKDTLDGALSLLVRYSVIKVTPSKGDKSLSISIHRLVQAVMRCELEEKNKNIETLEEVMRLLGNSLNGETVDHAICIWNFMDKLEAYNTVEKFIDTRENIVFVLQCNLRFDAAFDFLKKGEKHIALFPTQASLKSYLKEKYLIAESFGSIRKYSEAIFLLEMALRNKLELFPIRSQVPIDVEVEILKIKSLKTLFESEVFPEIKSFIIDDLSEISVQWLTLLKDCHNIYSLKNLHKIAEIHIQRKNYEEAIAIYRHLKDELSIIETHSNKEKVNAIMLSLDVNNFWIATDKSECTESLERLLKETFCVRNLLPARYIAMLFTVCNMACCEGKFEKCLEFGNMCLESHGGVFNKLHSDFDEFNFRVKIIMALALCEIGRLEEAKSLLRDGNSIIRAIEADHPDMSKEIIRELLYIRCKIACDSENHDTALLIMEAFLNDDLEKPICIREGVLLFGICMCSFLCTLVKCNEFQKALRCKERLYEIIANVPDKCYITRKVPKTIAQIRLTFPFVKGQF